MKVFMWSMGSLIRLGDILSRFLNVQEQNLSWRLIFCVFCKAQGRAVYLMILRFFFFFYKVFLYFFLFPTHQFLLILICCTECGCSYINDQVFYEVKMLENIAHFLTSFFFLYHALQLMVLWEFLKKFFSTYFLYINIIQS